MQFLAFTMFAPFAAIGEIAVGERRMSWNRPAESAVLGLVAAALGIRRSEDDQHRSLHEQFHYAVETNRFGKAVFDFHTAQSPFGRDAQAARTRAQQLHTPSNNLHTTVSTREWRTDTFFIAILWSRNQGSEYSLEGIRDALLKPSFTLSMGRKSAPFGLPLSPRIVEARDLLDALNKFEFTELEQHVMTSFVEESPRNIAFDLHATGVPQDTDFRIERRRDSVFSRSRWQFDERDEGVLDLEPRASGKDNDVSI